jgi:flavorubredoxin
VKRVLIAYFSPGGNTEAMANYIAEGVRFGGNQAVTKKISEIKKAEDLAGYDGYIFGSPTYSLDVPEPMKKFLLMLPRAGLEGKLGGAFGTYTHDVAYQHDDYAPAIIFSALQDTGKMEAFELGPFHLKDELVPTSEGMKACQDYGKTFSQKLAG